MLVYSVLCLNMPCGTERKKTKWFVKICNTFFLFNEIVLHLHHCCI